MKNILRNRLSLVIAILAMAFYLSGCYETHYYHRYHHHTREWYPRHHMPPPPGVNFGVDVR